MMILFYIWLISTIIVISLITILEGFKFFFENLGNFKELKKIG
jgi:hypothetical protein